MKESQLYFICLNVWLAAEMRETPWICVLFVGVYAVMSFIHDGREQRVTT